MGLHLSEASEQLAKKAAQISLDWRHYYLSCEHYFAAAVAVDASCRNWLASKGLDSASLEKEVLELLPLGDDKVPAWNGQQSPRLRRLLGKPAQEMAESCRAMRVEPKHIVAAILSDPKCIPSRILVERGVDLRKAGGELLGGVFPSVSSGGGDGASPERVSSSGEGKKKEKKEKMLAKYSRDLVARAREGKIDPVVGRNDEIRRVLTILARKTKSNPVLTGEAGVGKTAVVLGLAQRIAEGKVPDQLKDRRLLELNLTAMLAGAKHRGEFEERLQGVMEEVLEDPRIVLFIDELHQLVGAGDSRGGMDASNILKPALARGDFPLIGATTTDEYRKSIELDPALERRFQPVLVGEPSEEDAFTILKGLSKNYESHHGVKFPEEALLAAVKLSVRFLPDRNLPDKAIDLIDESAARIKNRSGVFEGEAGQVKFEVTPDVIAEVVSDWTGIPVNRMTAEESERLLEMETLLQQRVVGQDHACLAVAQTIRVVRMGLVSPTRPGGVFFFLGPSGVGKTELAKGLAEFLFGSEKEMVRFDMSEFHDKHSISRLIGSPPGYVGHDEEGQLTGAVRTKPYSVVLLDEVEKAHPEVFDLFLQVFDDGRLTDSKGRTVNFTNTIIVMTSNLGSRDAAAAGERVGVAGQLESLPPSYQKALRGHFRPEFLNRIDEIVLFRALEKSDLTSIVTMQLESLRKQARAQSGLELSCTPEAVELIIEKGYQPEFGARPIARAIDHHLKRPLASELLRRKYPPSTELEVVRDGDELSFVTRSREEIGGTLGAD